MLLPLAWPLTLPLPYAGLAEELSPRVRYLFLSFLHHLLAGRGREAAALLLQWSERQDCPRPSAFTADMVRLTAELCDLSSPAGIDLDAVMKSVLALARQHEVAIDSCFASLVVGLCVIVGFGASLDPSVNLCDAAIPCLLAHQLTGRVMGRLYC